MNTRSLQLLTASALLFGVIRVLLIWDELPDTVASHFDAHGRPNGFSTKEQFFIVYSLTMAFVFASLLVTIPLMRIIPVKYLNIPHREYWLTPERLGETRAKIRKAMWWMCLATAVLSAGVLELVLRSNLRESSFSSGGMWVLMGTYLAFTAIWVVKMMTSFKPPA